MEKKLAPVRFLLDENLDERLVVVLVALGHEAEHVKGLGLQGASDQQLVAIAEQYEVFITLDLHRQEAEWIAVNEALVNTGIRILRVRLPDKPTNLMLELVRALTSRMDQWLAQFRDDKVLVTLRHIGTTSSARTREEVRAMLDSRR